MTMGLSMTSDEAVAICREAGVRLVRFLYCDNGGIVRAKAAHVERLVDRMRTGSVGPWRCRR
jgi:glutamine synthetase